MSELARLADRFRLLALAGRGAAGAVYRAVDEATGEPVAVKLGSGVAGDDHSERRFEREIAILQSIQSPHLVRYLAQGRDPQGVPFLVVEWLEGEDLARRLRRDPPGPAEVLSIVTQVAKGLSALHARGVIHRDVKPANIMLSPTAQGVRAVLIDLGVAHIESSAHLTRAGTMIGTPQFMSPEQVLGGDDVTCASDVFSLGVVTLELLSGRRAYTGTDVVAIVAKIALSDPPRLVDLLPGAPAALDALLATAMAKSPAARFATAHALVDALHALDLPSVLAALSVEHAHARGDDAETSAASIPSIGVAERRVVTALFARLPPDADVGLFDAIVRERGGESHRLLSLAHVAVFGASRSTGDEAARAARAALLVRDAFPGAVLALSTGRALTGSVELSGDAIDRGAKVIEGTRIPTVSVDETTARLLDGAFELEDHGGSPRLVRERDHRWEPRALLGRRAACVGREGEIAWLASTLEGVTRDRRARAVVLLAPAGAGKTRVLLELLTRHARYAGQTAPLRTVFGRTSSFGVGAPFGVVASAIREVARQGELEARLASPLKRTVREGERGRLLPLLAELAGALGREVVRAGDAVLVSDRLRDAFESWLEEATSDGPLLFVIDDLQFADAPSLSLLRGVLRVLSDRPLFVLGLARPTSVEPSAMLGPETAVLRLEPLDEDAVAELVSGALGHLATPTVIAQIVARSEGNAFFIEELIRAVAQRPLFGDDSAATSLPETVLGVVQARLDALGVSSKRVLKAASVLGESFWPGALAAILGESKEAVEPLLEELVSAEVITRAGSSRFEGEIEHAFRNALLRESAYELLFEEDRARAHKQAADWLCERSESDALVIARHYELALTPKRAAEFFARAAEQALVGSDFATSIACCERGLACGPEAPVVGRIQLTLAEANRWQGEIERGLAAAEAARAACEVGSVLWFGAVREAISAHGRLGHKDAIAPLARSAIEAQALPGAGSAQIAALVPAAVHMLYAGDLVVARLLSTRIETLASRERQLLPLARARVHQLRAAMAMHTGDLETAVDEQNAARLAYESLKDTRALAVVACNLGFTLLELGQYARAEDVLRQALTVAEHFGLSTVAPLALQNLGTVMTRRGRYAEAIGALTEAAQRFEERKDPRLSGASRLHLAIARLHLGEPESAAAEATVVLEGPFEPLRVGALAILSTLHLRAGRLSEAVRCGEEAVALLDRLGAVEEFQLTARIALAEALYAKGDAHDALTALASAREKLDETSARLRDPELRASYRRDVPEHARILELSGGDHEA